MTVGYAYRASLRALSDTMAATNQHYIRCLKPNMQKTPMLFHGDVMTRQLQHAGCSSNPTPNPNPNPSPTLTRTRILPLPTDC